MQRLLQEADIKFYSKYTILFASMLFWRYYGYSLFFGKLVLTEIIQNIHYYYLYYTNFIIVSIV